MPSSVRYLSAVPIDADETCPVPEHVLARLRRDNDPAAADDFPEAVRARLAVFCNSRAHFRELGLRLARGCTERALVESAGGAAGAVLFAQSRAAPAMPQPMRGRISLATASKSF